MGFLNVFSFLPLLSEAWMVNATQTIVGLFQTGLKLGGVYSSWHGLSIFVLMSQFKCNIREKSFAYQRAVF